MSDAELLVVRVGEADYGLPVAAVREVLRAPMITRIPHVPRAVRGVASIRGDIVAVVDLGLRLGGAETQADGRLVLVDSPTGDDAVGLLVDTVIGLTPLTAELEEAPDETEAALPAGFTETVVRVEDGRTVTVLALAPLLDLRTQREERDNGE